MVHMKKLSMQQVEAILEWMHALAHMMFIMEENKLKLFCNIIFSFLSEHNLDKVLYEEFKY